MAKRKRRAFTDEFKARTVKLVGESGKSIGVVARELDLTESAVRAWVRQTDSRATNRGQIMCYLHPSICRLTAGVARA
jgi:transposase-like protein